MAINERSYGIVPLRKQGNEWNVLLIQHSRALYWGFPKGHAEPGESPLEAANRELFEETHLKVVRFFSETPFEEHYNYKLHGQLINKTVSFFVAEVEGELLLQVEEVSGGEWFTVNEALQKLTYAIDKSVCRSAIDLALSSK
jgi:bis(5'-nucleosidyl)-tetraphosphatase